MNEDLRAAGGGIDFGWGLRLLSKSSYWCAMPSQLVHCKVSIELFGRSYYKVHKAIDAAYSFLGRGHRRLYHDNYAVATFARNFYPGDTEALYAAKFHLQLDEMCSENPAFRKSLERWARKRVKKRKTIKKTKSEEPMPAVIEQLRRDIEKLARVAELKRLIREG